MLNVIQPTEIAQEIYPFRNPPVAQYATVNSTRGPALHLSSIAVPTTIARMERIAETDPLEDRPTGNVVLRLTTLLAESHAHAAIFIGASEVESFEGDLLVHWQSSGKRVTIISPRQEEQPLRLYRKLSTGWSQLMQDPSPTDVTAALQWSLQ